MCRSIPSFRWIRSRCSGLNGSFSSDRNLRQAQSRYDALEKPDKTFRAGKCRAEVELTHDVILYLEMERTKDGEMTLLTASYILDGGAQIVEANPLAWEIWLALNEQEMAEEAEAL